ncbi:MAG: zinc ribbon domain-containing protein [Dehalococcoidia bacterium]|nr:zinc ribbon domain-containing protein [Dehalococcoidia bacterium]
MPLYEYYCSSCDGVFELIRPTRDASLEQPCPACDEDAKRIISRQWSAFIFREGYARRLPDDGGYYHFGKKVKSLITGPSDGFSHPEIDRPEPPEAPSIEEIEDFEQRQEVRAKTDPELVATVIDDVVRADREIKKRMVQTKGSRVTEAAKRRALAAERALTKKNPSEP